MQLRKQPGRIAARAVTVSVPQSMKVRMTAKVGVNAIDDGQRYDSTVR